jgi:aconitate hydratase
LGTLAIGAGGLDVAIAMGGGPFYMVMPEILGVNLTGKLRPWVTAKDVILALLGHLTVKGGVGKILEYFGPGVSTLTVDQRATICNMGAELGATSSIFPSDEQTRQYLNAQGRGSAFIPLVPDADIEYDAVMDLDLSTLVPLIAQPSMPDNVTTVSSLIGTPVAQVCIGGCVNSSYEDLQTVAAVLKNKHVHPNVSLTITPGSKQVYTMIAQNGVLADLINAGARILESACGPCLGMGQAPATGTVTIRAFNRNFKGRSGTAEDQSYLASPETCAATALTGVISDPRTLGEPIQLLQPARYSTNDNMIIPPLSEEDAVNVKVIRGPNIKPVPSAPRLSNSIRGTVLLKVGDNITTDHIMPAGAKILPLRSNIPAISEFVFARVDSEFVARAKERQGGIIIGGLNYGQGSSREHAALAPMYLGIKAIVSLSFSRIHHANLVNMGILPLSFLQTGDYQRLSQDDELEITNLITGLESGDTVTVKNLTQDYCFTVKHSLSARDTAILLEGGLINYTKSRETHRDL